MNKFDLGFIGSGNMGGALAKAASKSNGSIVLNDKCEEKAISLSKEINASFSDTKDVAKNSRFIFFGVKPQFLNSLTEEITSVLKERNDKYIIVSMLAGVKIEKIRKELSLDVPVIRIMPNTPAAVGKGMILYCVSDNVTSDDEKEFLKFMENAGEFSKLPENLIDAGSAVSGCGPAFAYMFIDALTSGGVMCGLTKDQARKYAVETIIGSCEMVKQTGLSPSDLKDNVCSPAGSTIEGVKALEDNAFKAAVMEAVKKAYLRTVELGK